MILFFPTPTLLYRATPLPLGNCCGSGFSTTSVRSGFPKWNRIFPREASFCTGRSSGAIFLPSKSSSQGNGTMQEPELLIYETFAGIQGESTHAGRLCFFIRLTGCNLRCSYCDTKKAQPIGSGTKRTIDFLGEGGGRIGTAPGHWSRSPGGEPMLQTPTPELCRRLLNAGIRGPNGNQRQRGSPQRCPPRSNASSTGKPPPPGNRTGCSNPTTGISGNMTR